MPAGQERRQTLNAVRSEHATTTTAKMTSCRAHRKLYAQDILIDLMELQIKFAGFAVITTDAIATDPHFPDESRYGFRNPLCVITKLDAVSAVTQLPRPGLIWFWPELEHYIAEALDAFQGDHFSYVGEADHGGTGSHPSSTTSWTTNSASWTPSAYLNTPTTTTAFTTLRASPETPRTERTKMETACRTAAKIRRYSEVVKRRNLLALQRSSAHNTGIFTQAEPAR